MSTRVYGASDDLIEFDGDVSGEVDYYSGDCEDEGCLLVFSDGTLLAAAYGKPGHGAVWGLRLVQRGTLFDRIDECFDEDAKPYSDVAHFRDGLKFAFAAKSWERVS